MDILDKNLGILIAAFAATFWGPATPAKSQERLSLTSPAFKNNQEIPAEYTCDGNDVNPPLVIAGVPEGTKTLALIVDDPDAPNGDWVHWVVYNIPPATLEIKTNSISGTEGPNSGDTIHYGGPCPPSGVHRYFFKLYAVDTTFPVTSKMNKYDLLKAMNGHILAETNLIGVYKRKGR